MLLGSGFVWEVLRLMVNVLLGPAHDFEYFQCLFAVACGLVEHMALCYLDGLFGMSGCVQKLRYLHNR